MLFSLSDSYYYLSLGESFITNGTFLDKTVTPPAPPVTAQNGIALVGAALRWLCGIESSITLLYIISGKNFIVMLAYFVVQTLIFKELRIRTLYNNIIMLTIALGYSRLHSLFQGLNEPFYLLFTALIILLTLRYHKHLSFKIFSLLLFLGILASLFKIHSFIPFVAASFAFLYLGQLKNSLLFLILSIDQSGIQALKEQTFDRYGVKFFLNGILETFSKALSSLVFMRSDSYLGFLLFIAGTTFLYKFKKTKEFSTLYLSLFVLMYIVFFQLFYIYISRYFLAILPFLILMLIFVVKKDYRSIVLGIYTLGIFTMTVSNYAYARNYTQNYDNYETLKKKLPNDYDLISDQRRLMYFLLDKPSVKNNFSTKKNIVIIGEKKFVENVSDYLRKRYLNKIEIEKSNSYFLIGWTKLEIHFAYVP